MKLGVLSNPCPCCGHTQHKARPCVVTGCRCVWDKDAAFQWWDGARADAALMGAAVVVSREHEVKRGEKNWWNSPTPERMARKMAEVFTAHGLRLWAGPDKWPLETVAMAAAKAATGMYAHAFNGVPGFGAKQPSFDSVFGTVLREISEAVQDTASEKAGGQEQKRDNAGQRESICPHCGRKPMDTLCANGPEMVVSGFLCNHCGYLEDIRFLPEWALPRINKPTDEQIIHNLRSRLADGTRCPHFFAKAGAFYRMGQWFQECRACGAECAVKGGV